MKETMKAAIDTTTKTKTETKTEDAHKRRERMIQVIDSGADLSHWRDWRWQVRHCVHDVETFEELLGIRLEPEMREDVIRAVTKFPMSITPYYLSLIDTEDMANDPVFRQAFPVAAGADPRPRRHGRPAARRQGLARARA